MLNKKRLKKKLTHAFNLMRPGYAAANETHKEASRYLEQGRQLYNKKDYHRAEDCFREAVLADERYPLAHYYLGLCLYKLDQSPQAITCWKRTIEVGPGSNAAFKAEKKITYADRQVNEVISELKSRLK